MKQSFGVFLKERYKAHDNVNDSDSFTLLTVIIILLLMRQRPFLWVGTQSNLLCRGAHAVAVAVAVAVAAAAVRGRPFVL